MYNRRPSAVSGNPNSAKSLLRAKPLRSFPRRQPISAPSLHQDRLIPVPKQSPPLPMPHIKSPRHRVLQPLHPGHKICLWSLDTQMIMITHQHPPMHPPIRHPASLRQRPEEKATVLIIEIDVFPDTSAKSQLQCVSYSLLHSLALALQRGSKSMSKRMKKEIRSCGLFALTSSRRFPRAIT